jgi:hypothetical protein
LVSQLYQINNIHIIIKNLSYIKLELPKIPAKVFRKLFIVSSGSSELLPSLLLAAEKRAPVVLNGLLVALVALETGRLGTAGGDCPIVDEDVVIIGPVLTFVFGIEGKVFMRLGGILGLDGTACCVGSPRVVCAFTFPMSSCSFNFSSF